MTKPLTKRQREEIEELKRQVEVQKRLPEQIVLQNLQQIAFEEGLKVGEANEIIREAADHLINALTTILQTAISARYLSSKTMRAEMVKRLFSLDYIQIDRARLLIDAHNLFSAIKDHGPIIARAYINANVYDNYAPLLSTAGKFTDALKKMEDSGDVDDLLNAIEAIDEDAISKSFAKAKAHPIKLPSGPQSATPITQYILKETKAIKELHHGTDGETYIEFMKQLRQFDYVRNWITALEEYQKQPADKRDKNKNPALRINDQPIEVQAYDQAKGRDRQKGGRYLSDMRQNEKDRMR